MGTLQYRKRYELLQQPPKYFFYYKFCYCYNTASGMSCCNLERLALAENEKKLQYRKRYELLQRYGNYQPISVKQTAGYNTASGMSCCNSGAWEGLILLG